MDWASLITPAIIAAVPLLTMFVKKVVPDKAKVAIPLVAVAFGPVLEAVASGLQSQPASPGKGLLLGAAGVALREVVDQAKKLNAPPAAILIPFLLLAPGSVEAYTCNAGGCTWNTAYGEPATLTNGQPLTDLQSCTATYTVSVDGAAAGSPKTFNTPASKPAGGGTVSRDNTDASMAPGHTYSISEVIACTSTAFGTGAASPPAVLLMNNGVSPNPAVAPVLK